ARLLALPSFPTRRSSDLAEILEQPQSAQHDGEAEVEVGRGGVDTELDPQRTAGRELLAELVCGDDVDGAGGQQLHLAVDVHDDRSEEHTSELQSRSDLVC